MTVHSNQSIGAFRSWIRSRFAELNTELEACYASQQNRSAVSGVGEGLKAQLVEEGRQLILPILAVGQDTLGPDEKFELLGDVGYYMAACRRHEITEPSRERSSPLIEASTLALRLGADLGTAPRFVTSHMQSHNRAIAGAYRTFTNHEAEKIFLDFNTRSSFAYARAADALVRVQPMGLSHPVTFDLLVEAERALTDALRLNNELSETLDVDDFFFYVRPYYKPYRVGSQEYRGANAGDFAAFNQIDLLLGLCSANDPSYTQVVLEKAPYLAPSEQPLLHEAFRYPNMLDGFLDLAESSNEPWFQRNLSAFLGVCDAHGTAAAQHHDDLVRKFIEKPSASLGPEQMEGITASGPPLAVLLHALEKLRDQRLAAQRDDIPTRHDDLAILRAMIHR